MRSPRGGEGREKRRLKEKKGKARRHPVWGGTPGAGSGEGSRRLEQAIMGGNERNGDNEGIFYRLVPVVGGGGSFRRAIALGGYHEARNQSRSGPLSHCSAQFDGGLVRMMEGRNGKNTIFLGYASVSRIMDVLITAHGTLYEAAVRIAPGWPGREKATGKIN